MAQFILDFYCHDCKLALEIDGSIHDEEDQKLYDEARDLIINELGISVLRFKNNEVFEQLEVVLNKIRFELNRLSNILKSSPDGEDLGGVKS